MDFEKCILILKQAIQKLNINMYHLQGEANTKSVLDLLTQIDDEIGKTPKPRTNFDRITESEQAFVKWVLDNYYSVPKFFPCETKCNGDCEECFIEWLQKECEK